MLGIRSLKFAAVAAILFFVIPEQSLALPDDCIPHAKDPSAPVAAQDAGDTQFGECDPNDPPPTPVPFSVPSSDADGSFSVSWGLSFGANRYELWQRLNSGSWTRIQNSSARSRSITGLGAGTWYYRVRACSIYGCSFYTPTRSVVVTIAPPTPPATFTVPSSDTNGAFSVSWSASSGATRYELWQRLNSGSWSRIQNTSATSRSISGLGNGTWYYRVRACNANGCGAYTSTRSTVVTLPPPVPPSLSVPSSDSDGAFSVSWGASSGATRYELWQRISGGTWNIIQNTSARSRSISGLTNGTWQYMVRACNGSGCSAYTAVRSVVVNIPPPIPPVPTVAGPSSDSDGAFRLTWGEQSSSDTHYVQRRLNSGSWSSEITRTVPYFDESTSQEGTWRYRVRSCNTTGCSVHSSQKSVVVDFPAPVAATPLPPAAFSDPGSSAASDQVGTMEGAFRVNEGGAASYSIPISLADGTAGVRPSVSLEYSSGSANGVAGLGWSLSGLSMISRCRQSLDQDKNPEPIRFSSADRYCLDGQRLVLESGSSYGAANSVYRTEIESGAIITIRGNSSGEPNYFEVQRKDGSTSYYGRTPANSGGYAKLGKAAGNTLHWGIREFRDSVGNSIWFDYENSSDALRIQHIKYAFGSNSGPSGYNARVTFVYSTTARPDPISGYVSGYKFTNDRLLTNIRSYNTVSGGEHLVRDYVLRYGENQSVSTDVLSRLTSVQECASGRCLPKTRFDWRLPSATAPLSLLSSKSLAESNNISDFTLADIDGDGRMDIAWLEGATNGNPHLNYALFNGTQFVQTAFTTGSMEFRISGGAENLKAIDYNLDGRQDIAYWSESSQRWKVIRSEPQAHGRWKLRTSIYTTPISEEEVSFVDVNGDGSTDAVWSTSVSGTTGQLYVSLLKPVTSLPIESAAYYRFSTPIVISANANYTRGGVKAVAADFNGDGRVGIVTGYANTFCNNEDFPYATRPPAGVGAEGAAKSAAPSPNFEECDGIKHASALNIVDVETSSPAVERYSNLNLQGPIDRWTEHVYVKDLVVTDVNGDGLSDLFYPVYHDGDGEQNRFYFALNKGDGNFEVTSMYSSQIHADDARRPQFVDWNGDGYQDLLWKETVGSAEVWVRYFDPVTNRFGTTSRVMYVSSTLNESVYFPDLNGDSVPDVLRLDTSSGAGVVRVYTRRLGGTVVNQASNRIERITNGIGGVTEIDYEPLSTTANYDRLEVGTTTGSQRVCEGDDLAGPGPGRRFCYDEPVQVADSASFYSKINGDWDLPSEAQTLGKNSPILELNGPIYVVTQVSGSAPTWDDANAMSSVSYRYGEAKMQAAGRGFLGFSRLTSVDEQSGAKTETRYRQDWPFLGRPMSTTVVSDSGAILSTTTTDWEIHGFSASMVATYENSGSDAIGPIHVVEKSSEEKTYGLVGPTGTSTGPLVSTVNTEYDYDSEANVTQTVAETRSGDDTLLKRVTTDNTYLGGAFQAFESRLYEATTTTYRQGQTVDLVKKSRFNYYTSGPHRGLLQEEIVEPTDSAYMRKTIHSYDTFGNRVQSKVVGGNVTRCNVNTITFDSIGRYKTSERDCLGRTTNVVTARNNLGFQTAAEVYVGGSASVTNRARYGALGRAYYNHSDTGGSSTVYYSSSTTNCPAGTAFKITQTDAGGSRSEQCMDKLGRALRQLSVAFDGTWNAKDTGYDRFGRIVRESEPFNLHYDGNSALHWTIMEYDIVGRVTQMRMPDNSLNTISRSGLTTVSANALGHEKTEVRNALGEVVRTEDNIGGVTTFEYDHQGHLVRTIDNAGNQTTAKFDKLGRKEWREDPDSGRWHYSYNNFGELALQRDAKNQTTEMTYDGLGRIKTRIDRTSPGGSIESDTEWYYDSAANGLGRVDYVIDRHTGYQKAYLYDAFGRLSEKVTSIGGSSYYDRKTYDQYGRDFQYFDAAGGYGSSDSGITQRYNAFGYVESIADALEINGEPLTTYQQIDWVNPRGQITVEKRGISWDSSAPSATISYSFFGETGRIEKILATNRNGQKIQHLEYLWDVVGNLSHRKELSGNKNLEELFDYDALNRLTDYGISSNRVHVDYDLQGLGNILRKSDVQGDYLYGSGSAGPHAVTRFDGSNYYYDANGNNTSGGGRTIGYTVFDKAKRITKNGHQTDFAYDVDRSRYERVDTSSDGTQRTRYVGSVEIIDMPNGDQHRKRTIGGFAVETTVYRNNSQLSKATNYLFHDHLGSLDVIADASGNLVQDLSFDPWGKRRSGIDWTTFSGTELRTFDHSITTRGFTGHEMLDEVGIIHMNGRIYDPHMGRFLQADPFIQDPTYSQSLNRYSYVLNNPLNATDPSGHFLSLLIGAIMYLAKVELTHIVIGMFFAGVAEALIQGASGFDALLSGLSAAAFAYLGGTLSPSVFGFNAATLGFVAAMGTLGGITSVLGGGDFGNGFRMAAISSVAGGLSTRMTGGISGLKGRFARIIAGGTVSEVTGGKFKNGALSAAFMEVVQSVNQEPPATGGDSESDSGSGEPNYRSAVPDGQVTVDYDQLKTTEDWTHAQNGLRALQGDPEVDTWSLQNALWNVDLGLSRSRFYSPSESDLLVKQMMMMRDDLQSDILKTWAVMAAPFGGYYIGGGIVRGGAWLMNGARGGSAVFRDRAIACMSAGMLVCAVDLTQPALMRTPRGAQRFINDTRIHQTVREGMERARKAYEIFLTPK